MNFHISLNRCFLIPPLAYDQFIDELLSEINQPYNNIDLLVSAWFESDINLISAVFEILKSKKFKSIKLLLDQWQRPNYGHGFGIPANFVNFVAIATNKIYKVDVTNRSNTGIGLLLTGTKCHRLQHIGLLKRLYNANFLTTNNIFWSFRTEGLELYNFAKADPYIDYTNIKSEIKYFNEHSLDKTNDPTMEVLDLSVIKNVSAINHMYNLTDYSIITETFFIENNPSVTEKTYRAILNKHPFILVGSKGCLQYLKNFGFKTFEEYFTISDYDNIVDPYERLDAITKNILEFPLVLTKFKNEINSDVDYNYNKLNEIIEEDNKIITNEYLIRKLPISDIDRKFQFNFCYSFLDNNELNEFVFKFKKVADKKSWIQNYNNIKGTDWPDLNSPDEFHLLPKYMQEECIKVFNLRLDYNK